MVFRSIVMYSLYAFFFLIELGTGWRLKSIKSFIQKYAVCFWLSIIFVVGDSLLNFRYDDVKVLTTIFRIKIIFHIFANSLLLVYLCFRGVQLATTFIEVFVKGEVFMFSQLSTLVIKLQEHPIRAYMLIIFCIIALHAGDIIAMFTLSNIM